MTERKEAVRAATDLDEMAERIADVLNGLAHKLPIDPGDVDLRVVAELCFALDVTPSLDIRPLSGGKQEAGSE